MDRLEQLLEMLNDNPGDNFLLFALAKEYEKKDNLKQAKHYYIELTNKHPKYVGTYYHLGQLYQKEGELKLALQSYEKGMKIAQEVNDEHSYRELANAKLNLEMEMI